MTPEDQAKYGRVRTMCEFVTSVASVMEDSGALDESLTARMETSLGPVREARDWMWHIGQLMAYSRPLPNGVHEGLETTETCAREALPRFRALMDEACDELVRASRGPGPAAGRSAGSPKAAPYRLH